MFVLEIEFLSGVYYAASHHHRAQAEWPPHPGRLYSALVATAYETGIGEEGLQALRWLETAGDPMIWAADAEERSPYTSYVPVNARAPIGHDMARGNRQPRQFPAAVPAHPVVWMVWPDPAEEMRGVLAELAMRLGHLGSSRSLVRATVRTDLPADCRQTHHQWVPDQGGTELLRVPYPGRLAELDEAHALSQGRRHVQRAPLGRMVAYGRDPQVLTPAPHPIWGEWIIYRQESGLLPLEAALRLTQAVRDTLKASAPETLLPWVLGQGNHSHLAILPLPFVGSAHSTGQIMGVGLLLPIGVPDPVRLQLYRLVAQLRDVVLPGIGTVELRREPPAGLQDLPRALQPATWSRRSATWQSVTPVILDRFPKGGEADAIAQIRQACEYTGLPAPVEVSFTRTGTFLGVPPVHDFFLRQREGEAPRPAYHLRLRFDQPVYGPVLLGAGRFLGLGLCRPSWEGGRGHKR